MNSVRATRHAQRRLRQRGFRRSDLTLVVTYGTEVREGYILLNKDVDDLAAQSRLRGRQTEEVDVGPKLLAERCQRLVGTFIPRAEGSLLSIYRAGPRKMARLLRELRPREQRRRRAVR